MDKIVNMPAGGVVKRVKISYQSRPDAGSSMDLPMSLVVVTRYGIVFAVLGMENIGVRSGWGTSPVFMLDFDTQTSVAGEEEKAVAEFAADFDKLPDGVEWNTTAEMEYKIQDTSPALDIKITKMSVGTYSGKNVWATEDFMKDFFSTVEQELAQMGILRQGAILSLLKFKAIFPGDGYSKEQIDKLGSRIDKVLGRIIKEEDRAAILMHEDRSIRLAGASVLARTTKVVPRKPANRRRV